MSSVSMTTTEEVGFGGGVEADEETDEPEVGFICAPRSNDCMVLDAAMLVAVTAFPDSIAGCAAQQSERLLCLGQVKNDAQCS